jgi:hypothetical protein
MPPHRVPPRARNLSVMVQYFSLTNQFQPEQLNLCPRLLLPEDYFVFSILSLMDFIRFDLAISGMTSDATYCLVLASNCEANPFSLPF